MRIQYTLDRDEIKQMIPFALICETREGSRWDMTKTKRRWLSEFSEDERESCYRLFQMAHRWYLRTGVPDEVTMTGKTLALWRKLADFCASI